MFKNLFDLSIKRTGIEILGFYLFYSIAGSIVVGFVCGILIFVLYPQAVISNDIQRLAILFGSVAAVLFSVGLSLAIIASKRIFNSFKAVLLTIFAVILSGLFGALIGMIPVAYLTSFDSQNPVVHN